MFRRKLSQEAHQNGAGSDTLLAALDEVIRRTDREAQATT